MWSLVLVLLATGIPAIVLSRMATADRRVRWPRDQARTGRRGVVASILCTIAAIVWFLVVGIDT